MSLLREELYSGSAVDPVESGCEEVQRTEQVCVAGGQEQEVCVRALVRKERLPASATCGELIQLREVHSAMCRYEES